MLFNSVEFLVFLPLVALLYFQLPPQKRWVLLLAASYLFYMAWNPAYVLLILASTLVDYVAGLRMGRHSERPGRRPWLALSLVANLGLLFSFKYFNFAADALRAVLVPLGLRIDVPYLDVLLPVGISFYTFQTLSYSIEVYLGRQTPIRHLGRFALYVSFFPQLVAGPIERPQRLLPQLEAHHNFDYDRVVDGLRLALWGLFKKVVIADRLAVVVDAVYGQPDRYPGSFLALATIFFAFQIYCDFSGYTDIARGVARIFGIDLMLNFRRPYFATSIADFWRRWHISLSTWFRDYVYIPLGGNRVTRGRWLLGLLAVFGLSGIWHGANWTFLAWGLIHAGYYIVGSVTTRHRTALAKATGLTRGPKFHRTLQMLATFLLVSLAWIVFRAETIADAWYILTHAGTGWFGLAEYGGMGRLAGAMDLSARALQLNAALIGLLLTIEARCGEREPSEVLSASPLWIRWPVYAMVGWAIMNLGMTEEIPFVYFQF